MINEFLMSSKLLLTQTRILNNIIDKKEDYMWLCVCV